MQKLQRLATRRNLIILLVILTPYILNALFPVLKVPRPIVSLAAEPVIHLGSFAITNSVVTTWLVMLLLIVVSLIGTRRIPANISAASNRDLVPSGLQNLLEILIEAIYNLTKSVAGLWTSKFFPVVATIFIFVLLSNFSGLLPGVGSIGLLEHPHGAGEEGFLANGALLTATAPAAGEEGYIVVPFLDVAEVADHRDVDVLAALDRDDGLLRRLAVRLEIDMAVDAAIRAALLAAEGNRVDQRHSPPLELVVVLIGQRLRPADVLRRAVDFELDAGEGVAEALLDQRDGEVGHVDADPLPAELLAAWIVVPQPQKGSSTTSPGLDEAGDDSL